MLRQCQPRWRLLQAAGRVSAGRTAANRIRMSSTTSETDSSIVDLPVNAPAVDPEDQGNNPLTRSPRRSRMTRDKDSEPSMVPLPDDLAILWTLNDSFPNTHALPPPEIFDDALQKLNLTLHPLNQSKASLSSSPSVEPNLCLYCPIEGGNYIIDATVQELARRTLADVVVLDAAHLAAGEWGHFGKANPLNISPNPLHLPPSSSQRAPGSSQDFETPSPSTDDAGDEDMTSPLMNQLSLHLVTRPGASGSNVVTPKRQRISPKSKLHIFFDTLVNIALQHESVGQPRLIYIRDFPILADSSPTWYPSLLQSIQERRGRFKSCPVTIIFGASPPITSSSNRPSASPSPSLLQVLSRTSSQASPPSNKPTKVDWSETDTAEKSREKRLQNRLRKWERDDGSLQADIPTLVSSDSADTRPDVVIVGSQIPSFLSPPSAPSPTTNFFKTSVIVPGKRTMADERSCRIKRRQEINHLSMRMAIGAIGGQLGPHPDLNSPIEVPPSTSSAPPVEDNAQDDLPKMMEDWGHKVEEWPSVRKIADRALGSVITLGNLRISQTDPLIHPTVVPWSALLGAWLSSKSSKDLRRSWIKDSTTLKLGREMEDEEEDEDEEDDDNIVEMVRNDPDLDTHEQRLLPCIVDTASMPTSFSQVHLPARTIDSIRTVVSLPLLYPGAFQHGILKDYGINGCLLFGPPGTGKTLLVRALAREAGCQMLVISPSDVMDMFVGEGEKMVKAVFSLARRLSPCVVFLDEIDALFGARVSREHSGGAFAHRGVITEFMQEMDGLTTSTDDSVIVIGATNRPGDLDDAVLRRLPRRLLVDLPGEPEREAILKIMLREEDLHSDVDMSFLAKTTASFSGSDLKHLCVSAALAAIKESHVVPWVVDGVSATKAESTEKQEQPVESPPAEAAIPESTTTESAIPESTNAESAIPESASAESQTDKLDEQAKEKEAVPRRTLSWRHFKKALSEITPSSSETLGSLAELRKWNEEFGEGQKERKRSQVWGKDRFGFTQKEIGQNDPRVEVPRIPAEST